VVESGHQPNFLPHAGTFKKVFLLHFLSSFKEIIPLFGIYDYNQATAKWLYQNRVPDINKNGFKKIGFKISKKDMWKRFDMLNKPSEGEWEKEVRKIVEHYRGSNIELIEEELWRSYELGENFADVNSILFVRLCQHLGISVIFFKYSDVQKKGIFIEEWKRVSKNVERFNKLYNSAVSKRNLYDLGYNELDLAPFWYLCECGGNVPVYYKTKFKGRCPVCNQEHEFENIEKVFDRLSPRAVFRNLVFTSGLETSVFISGSGGSLRYGIVSNEMYPDYGIRRPITIYWKSRDFHLSPIYRKVISEISRLFGQDFLNLDIERVRNEWAEKINDRKVKGYYLYSDTLLQIANKAFSINPSFVDLVAGVGFEGISESWRKVLKNSSILEGEFISVLSDVDYGYAKYYTRVSELVEKSKKADPLGLIG